MKTTDTVRVQLNGKLRDVPEGQSVAELLASLELHPGMVVVELNKEILERDRYDAFTIGEGDTIELVHFVGGG